MALQINLSESNVGPAFSEAYARVNFFRGTKDDLLVLVYFYADAAARLANKDPVSRKEYQLVTEDLDGKFMSVIYTALKQLPDFDGAIDV